MLRIGLKDASRSPVDCNFALVHQKCCAPVEMILDDNDSHPIDLPMALKECLGEFIG